MSSEQESRFIEDRREIRSAESGAGGLGPCVKWALVDPAKACHFANTPHTTESVKEGMRDKDISKR